MLDPLVAITNALASHALYRGLLLEPRHSAAHALSGALLLRLDLPHGDSAALRRQYALRSQSAASSASSRTATNAGRRSNMLCCSQDWSPRSLAPWRSAGSIPSASLVRSIGLALLPAFNFAMRAVLAPLEHSHVSLQSERPANRCTPFCRPLSSISARRTSRRVSSWALLFLVDSRRQPARHSLLVPLSFARWVRCWAQCRAGQFSACTRTLRPATNATAACSTAREATIPSAALPWRKSECLMCMNCVGSCPHAVPAVPVSSATNAKSLRPTLAAAGP